MMNIINTAVYSMWTLIRELIQKFLQKKKNTFMSVWDDGCSFCLSWLSGHKVCKSNYYAVQLKLMKCCMSIVIQYN